MISAEEAKALAITQAGASDFGSSSFEEGLQRTVDAFARMPLHEDARGEAERKIVADLANRLRIEQWRKDHPFIADLPIEGPILVCGLPRTGTTATVGMMGLDEHFRFLRAWEANAPIPPARLREEASDPRAVAAREAAAAYPNRAQHISDPDGPEEDLALLAGLDMRALNGAYPMPDDYLDWWLESDFRDFYVYHRRLLQVLQSERPPYLWLLKSPPHLGKLEAFAAQYPNARFVMTHRDPVKVIASAASLFYTYNARRSLPDSLKKTDYGPRWLRFWSQAMRRGLEARTRIGEHRFIDVWNEDIVAKPIESFEAIYNQLGFEFTPALHGRIEDYNRRNARGAFGEHLYTPEEYGLTGAAVRVAFKDYIERFRL